MLVKSATSPSQRTDICTLICLTLISVPNWMLTCPKVLLGSVQSVLTLEIILVPSGFTLACVIRLCWIIWLIVWESTLWPWRKRWKPDERKLFVRSRHRSNVNIVSSSLLMSRSCSNIMFYTSGAHCPVSCQTRNPLIVQNVSSLLVISWPSCFTTALLIRKWWKRWT